MQRGHRHCLHQRYGYLFLGRSGLYPGGSALGCCPAGTLLSRHATQLARLDIFKLSLLADSAKGTAWGTTHWHSGTRAASAASLEPGLGFSTLRINHYATRGRHCALLFTVTVAARASRLRSSGSPAGSPAAGWQRPLAQRRSQPR